MMVDAPLMLGVSGLRGIVGESLTPEVTVRYAGVVGAALVERYGPAPSVAMGADGRVGWQSIAACVRAGLLGSGCSVVELGVATTPTVGVVVDQEGYDAGVVITASHNPQAWNGVKLLVSPTGAGEPVGCRAPSADDSAAIVEAFRGDGDCWRPPEETGLPWAADADAAAAHAVLFAMEDGVLVPDNGLRMVVDSVNSSGAAVAREFANVFGVELVQLHGLSSGVFPHTPEPTAENLSDAGGLCDAVPGLKADVGFAQDPDADRLAVVDETGRYIGEEYTLALCALSLLTAERDREGERVLVANLSTSRMIDDIAAAHGARVVRTPVGEANVVEAMKRLASEGCDVVVGGEGNGGVIWPDVVHVRDSVGSMALVLSLMARSGKSVSGLVAEIDGLIGGKGYTILKTKRPLTSQEDAAPAVSKIAARYGSESGAAVDTQDGVRIDWAERKAWVHVRASNTEPIMRLIAEAPGEDEARSLAEQVGSLIG